MVNQLSTGAKIGIGVGVGFMMIIIVVLGIFVFKLRNRALKAEKLNKPFGEQSPNLLYLFMSHILAQFL